MWSTDAAKGLIKEGRKSKDELTRRLADYLGYALTTVEYYEKLYTREVEKNKAKEVK